MLTLGQLPSPRPRGKLFDIATGEEIPQPRLASVPALVATALLEVAPLTGPGEPIIFPDAQSLLGALRRAYYALNLEEWMRLDPAPRETPEPEDGPRGA